MTEGGCVISFVNSHVSMWSIKSQTINYRKTLSYYGLYILIQGSIIITPLFVLDSREFSLTVNRKCRTWRRPKIPYRLWGYDKSIFNKSSIYNCYICEDTTVRSHRNNPATKTEKGSKIKNSCDRIYGRSYKIIIDVIYWNPNRLRHTT